MNNNEIFNAVISGAGGAFQQRWGVNSNSSSYSEFADNVQVIATTVDADIPAGTITAPESALMQSIAQGVFAGRYPFGAVTEDVYSDIAAVIVAIFTALRSALLPESGGGGGVLRADWGFWDFQTFDPTPGEQRTLTAFDSPGIYDDVEVDDILFVPPGAALEGFFHNAEEAPQLGGLWLVEAVDTENTSLTVSRDPRFSTTAQVNQTTLITVTDDIPDGSGGKGVYQVRTPKTAVFGTDPQVLSMVAIPPPPAGVGHVYYLSASVEKLFWTDQN